jgi:hypothetical protein
MSDGTSRCFIAPSSSLPRHGKSRCLCACRMPGVVWACGLLAAGQLSIPSRTMGSATLPVTAVRRRDRWAWTPRTRPVCRSPPYSLPGAPAVTACGPAPGGLTVRAIGWPSRRPGTLGAVATVGGAPAPPFRNKRRTCSLPLRGLSGVP